MSSHAEVSIIRLSGLQANALLPPALLQISIQFGNFPYPQLLVQLLQTAFSLQFHNRPATYLALYFHKLKDFHFENTHCEGLELQMR